MPTFRRTASRSKTKERLPPYQEAPKSRPNLQVTTSFSRHKAGAPEQVFPQKGNPSEARFINLKDVRSLSAESVPRQTTQQTAASEQQLNDGTYAPPLGNKPKVGPHPLLHRRIKGLRPLPLSLATDVSPSDRAIPIGIEVPSNTAVAHYDSPQSGAQLATGSSKELPTPTIVITPAKEDFDHTIHASPEDMRGWPGPRPASSVYSTYPKHPGGRNTNGTPPVPPLPLFASQSNASLQRPSGYSGGLGRAVISQTPPTRNSALSLQTVFEDEPTAALQTRSADSKRLTTASFVSRRSKGWWNLITSPFSPSGTIAQYLRSPTYTGDEDDGERTPMLAGASGMPRSRNHFANQDPASDEPRSAPELQTAGLTGLGYKAGPDHPAPKRSITAPGALDMGAADGLNIYRRPSKGAARSYYDSNSPNSDTNEVGETRGLADDGWSPSQSCYRPSRSSLRSSVDSGMRDSQFYVLPDDGEAAEYYNPNKRFPSLAPYGEGFGDRDLDGWDPRNSVAPVQGGGSLKAASIEGSLVESPAETDSCRSSRSGSIVSFDDSESSFGGPTPPAVAVPERPPYPDDKSPFDDIYEANHEESSRSVPGGPGVAPTPNTGNTSAFNDFSGTHPAARGAAFTFASPPVEAVNPRPSSMQRQESDDMFSPLETPQVEEARTATLMAPESHREVEVVSSRQPTPAPAGTGLGIGNATMASRGPSESEDGNSLAFEPVSEKPAMYGYQAPLARNDDRSYGGYAYHDRDNLYPPSRVLSEKANFSTTSSARGPEKEDTGTPTKRPWYRRFCLCLAGLVLVLVAALVVLLILFLPRGHDTGPVQAQWLNLTGFPPLPTGMATVIQPKPVQQVSGCVSQDALWSCAMPPDEGSRRTVPDFRFQILFRDGILPSNETAIEPSNSTLARRGLGHASGANQVARRSLFSSQLFMSSPAPPSIDDQKILGHTTDKLSAPYDGEATPFYISLLNASALTESSSSNLKKRVKRDWQYPYPTPQKSNATSSGSNFKYPGQGPSDSNSASEAAENIPKAAEGSDHAPAPAELYPLPSSQPLRLYNRGMNSEHYGFYTYFDRSLYVSSLANSSTSSNNITSATTTTSTGNVPLEDASAVCTWSQTRLHVQIWTQRADVAALNATSSSATKVPAVDSSANDMTAPGSFPYSVTITLDRHGGDASKKGVYCHSLDDEQHVLQDVRTWVVEDRSFGGELVHAAAVPTNGGLVGGKGRNENNDNGIDGGTGGCMCRWQNWG
ncbi:uncharacterized protein LTR77_001204 [Saxophila tyrrhenica]|uniref:Uncharacterized protein n=1 Tax=Saxophila tyrrhenica TaxID=1690608 RepID=A0AAV9PPC0_9PEZI|nr:hypothetical protein LTR77_001204 [Saxophila tyrrhenica]